MLGFFSWELLRDVLFDFFYYGLHGLVGDFWFSAAVKWLWFVGACFLVFVIDACYGSFADKEPFCYVLFTFASLHVFNNGVSFFVRYWLWHMISTITSYTSDYKKLKCYIGFVT